MDLTTAWKNLLEESTYPAEEPFKNRWTSPGKGYPRKVLGHWDTPLIAREILYFDPDRAKQLLLSYLVNSFRSADGMMALRVTAESDAFSEPGENGPDFSCSHPPVWTFTARRILEKKWDRDFASLCLDTGAKNIAWWENNRMDRTGLFWYYDSFPGEKKWESGYEESPRWDCKETGPFPCVDLNCQLILQLENLGFIAEGLGEGKTAKKFRDKRLALRKTANRYFWDESLGFFCDYELTRRNAQKTIASYWTLVSGTAEKDDVAKLLRALENKKEFGAAAGLPAVALSEPSFELDCWRGPMWLSQVFWVCAGLQRYALKESAQKIAARCLENAQRVLDETGKIWEFYNPLDCDLKKLKRKGDPAGPFPDYLGHNPLLSLELLKEGETV